MSFGDIHHYGADGEADRATCGTGLGGDLETSPYRADVTCPACLRALDAEAGTVTHYAATSKGDALCGADWPHGGITAWRSTTTCPACLAELRAGATGAAAADLELPDETGPAIACSQMHEHDEVACAAPSVAEMTVEAVGSALADLYARILGVFDDGADTAAALSRVGDRIEELLGVLGVPVPAAAFTPSSVCPVCEAKLVFNRWGEHSDAWAAEQVRLHIEGHASESAPAGPVETGRDAAELRCPHCRQRFVPSTGEVVGDQHRTAFTAHVTRCLAAVPSVTG